MSRPSGVLFSTYSHWRVLQGSEKLFQLVSDSSKTSSQSHELCWVLRPSKELENLVRLEDDQDDLSQHAIVDICKIYDLNTKDIIK
ncbi:hypothetical protein GLYMA_16G014900v4 [Glycine max]|nr:hypothetical protein GLYMA_16G014900v4 [Glycine max]KAG4379601.1 hypothetical protein GLYMA_16G014900v4 [Glycine max]KAG4937961.1 hypothetical protein JHK86_044102 [Glycine max]KAH1149461.1 hypothetical protein GYH30_043824 [Glycine max]KAH1149462.1 hypothetical protein GYH30_043824 [Glycine max]